MHILLAGGGTGGHINPALAIAATVRKYHPDARISFVGTPHGMESVLVPRAGFDFYPLDVAGFQRKPSLTNLKRNAGALYKLFLSSKRASKLLRELRPDVAGGTGGYVSGPILRKAQKMGIATAVHEQNAFPGVTTKLLAPKADAVMLAMPEAEKYLRLKKAPYITGNPVREAVLAASRARARARFGMDSRPMLLSFGGSLGAKRLNETVADVLAAHAHKADCYHYHATGKFGWEWMPRLLLEKGVDLSAMKQLRVTEYIDDMDLCLAAADLVICRAGAITLSELQAAGRAAILIPSPNVAENHQYYNAMTLANRGCAVVIEEKDLTSERLLAEVDRLLCDPALLREMGENAQKGAVFDANERIYTVLRNLF